MKIPLLNDFESTLSDPVWQKIAALILRRHNVDFTNLRRAEQGENIVFLIDAEYVLKIYTPRKNGFERERGGLELARGDTSLPIPEIFDFGEIEGFNYLIVSQLPGKMVTRDEWLALERPAKIALLAQLAFGLKELHSADPGDIHFDWHEFIKIQAASAVERQAASGGNPEWIASLPRYIEENLDLLPKSPDISFMHGDVHFGNLLATDHPTRPVISGLFDFADSLKGFIEYEFVAVGVLMIQGQGDLQREFFRAYGYRDDEINDKLRRRLMLLTVLYEHSSLKRYATRLRAGAESLTLTELEREIWNFV
ncbi:MAG: aminoglycoside phosphotransferase family protein [Pyrinomonadaceae bacterium]